LKEKKKKVIQHFLGGWVIKSPESSPSIIIVNHILTQKAANHYPTHQPTAHLTKSSTG